MIFIKVTNKKYLFRRIKAIVIPFPFCLYSNTFPVYRKNHESIHGKQFIEVAFISLIVLNCLISLDILNSYYWLFSSYLIYYIIYLIEMFIKRFIYKNWGLAYRNISFEREAYNNQYNTEYLYNRKFFSWIKYLFKNNNSLVL